MNGTFNISLKTPMGQKNGTLTLIDENGTFSGSLYALGKENPIRNGKSSGKNFEFEGTLRAGIMGKIDYTAQGTVIGDVLQATAKTKFGEMQINGTRVKK